MQTDSPLAVIIKNWRGYNDRLKACVAPLANEHLALQPAPGMWPLGQIVQHIVSVRAGWFSGTLQEKDPAMTDYMEWGWHDSPERTPAELVRGLDETWAFIESLLGRWSDSDFAAIFPDVDENDQPIEVSRAWVTYHVLEHDLHHGSEVSLILGMNGLTPIEI